MSQKTVDVYRRELLNSLQGKGICKCYRKGDIIEYPNESADYIYLIKRGYVKQFFIDKEGGEKTLLLLKDGDIFGEITYFQGDNSQVFTRALVNSELEKISVKAFALCLYAHSEIYLYLSLMMSNKVRILMAQIQDFSFCNAKKRLENLLVRLSAQHGEKVPEGVKINHYFTHEELACMISSTRSTVSKNLKKLEENGTILIEKNIIVVDMEGMVSSNV